jgi:hypothetical protein
VGLDPIEPPVGVDEAVNDLAVSKVGGQAGKFAQDFFSGHKFISKKERPLSFCD